MSSRPWPDSSDETDPEAGPHELDRWRAEAGPLSQGTPPAPLENPRGHARALLWQPRPLAEPRLSPEFDHLAPVARSVESVRFALASLERWLSPGGGLRAWLRLNAIVGLVLCISAVLAVPAITHVFGEVVTWTRLADTMAGHLSGAVLRLPPLVITAGALLLGVGVWRQVQARRAQRQRRPGYGYEDYH